MMSMESIPLLKLNRENEKKITISETRLALLTSRCERRKNEQISNAMGIDTNMWKRFV